MSRALNSYDAGMRALVQAKHRFSRVLASLAVAGLLAGCGDAPATPAASSPSASQAQVIAVPSATVVPPTAIPSATPLPPTVTPVPPTAVPSATALPPTVAPSPSAQKPSASIQASAPDCVARVDVSVKFPQLGGGTQTAFITAVNAASAPVARANGEMVVNYSTTSRSFRLAPTDARGTTGGQWSVGGPRGQVLVTVTETAGGCTATGSTTFQGR